MGIVKSKHEGQPVLLNEAVFRRSMLTEAQRTNQLLEAILAALTQSRR